MPLRPSTSVEEVPVSTSTPYDIAKSLSTLSLQDPTPQHEELHSLQPKRRLGSKIPTRSTSTLAAREIIESISPEQDPSSSPPFPLRRTSLKIGQQNAGLSPLEDDSHSPLGGRRAIRRFGYFTPPASPRRESKDRFIPPRRSPDSIIKSFCLSKPTQHLTKEERLLRTSSASPDPFSPRSPRRFADPTRVSMLGSSLTNRNDRGAVHTNIRLSVNNTPPLRRISAGTVWNVGGNAAPEPNHPVNAIPNGRGGLLGSGTNAPMFSSHFFETETPDESSERFEGRLAVALEIDQTTRTLEIPESPTRLGRPSLRRGSTAPGRLSHDSRTRWEHGRWVNDRILPARKSKPPEIKPVPTTAFRVLDAPQLRDDFYCSVLAYCHTSGTLAVGLRNRVYLWSEDSGVQCPRLEENRGSIYVTSLSFSSTAGGHSILAIGRNSGQVSLWSLHDENDRFQSQQPHAIACLAFKPITTRWPAEQRAGRSVLAEELLVGDELGNIYYYSIEWPSGADHRPGVETAGSMNLMAKISIHTQQICGLAWSPEGDYFATGGNDNICCLFEVQDVLAAPVPVLPTPITPSISGSSLRTLMPSLDDIPTFVPNAPGHRTLSSMLSSASLTPLPTPLPTPHPSLESLRTVPRRPALPLTLGPGRERHKWSHSAAVKAIAFCPWQRGLLATGGGSNDRAIHFYHSLSGACLATISVHAQVTSLIWSARRREICATFGYAQPEHPYRIAVFSWPECRQVVAIPWLGEIRALYAIAYPGGPNGRGEAEREGGGSGRGGRRGGEGGRWWEGTREEGCVVVAGSDESVKFHEVWSEGGRGVGRGAGLLGGSRILESLEGGGGEVEVMR